MHVTQSQGGASPEPRSILADELVGLLSNTDRFQSWIATSVAVPATPVVTAEPGRDSYVVTPAGMQALDEAPATEAPGTAARILRSAALYLERHGWTQHAYFDPTATIFTPAADMAGAIAMVCYGGPVEAPAQHFDDPGYLDFEEAVLHLDRYLLVHDGSEAYEFNDAPGRRLDDVLRVLREAASTPAHELIDALRAARLAEQRLTALLGGES